MESAICLIGGGLLVICGVALFWLRPPNWQDDGDLVDYHLKAIRRWGMFQRFVRFLNNLLLVSIGVLIVTTAFIPHGPEDPSRRTWMSVWSIILLMLLACIILAMVDALSSLAGYKRALPEAARRSFRSEELAAAALEGKDLKELSSDTQ